MTCISQVLEHCIAGMKLKVSHRSHPDLGARMLLCGREKMRESGRLGIGNLGA